MPSRPTYYPQLVLTRFSGDASDTLYYYPSSCEHKRNGRQSRLVLGTLYTEPYLSAFNHVSFWVALAGEFRMVLVTDLINSLGGYILQSCHRGFSFFPI